MPESENPQPESPKKPGAKKEMSNEARLLIAFVLMGLVLFLTPYFLPKPPAAPKPVKQEKPVDAQKASQPPAASAAAAVAAAPPAEAVVAQKEEISDIDTDVYHVKFSNRGAVVRSWVLKNYKDSSGHPLELVNELGASKIGFPFSLGSKVRIPPLT